MPFFKTLPVFYQYLLPQHLISRSIGKLAKTTRPVWLKNYLIRQFIRHYRVNMAEAIHPAAEDYANFNAFFTRELRPGIRPIDEHPDAIISPADSVISEIGHIQKDQLLQAKGHYYRVRDLLGGDAEQAALFENGCFATLYLAPKDYHRVHMPLDGQLTEMRHVPGQLFSVNPRTANTVPGLFARNERVVALFQTHMGAMAVVMVGAIIVASIATQWAGVISPPRYRNIRSWHYDDIFLKKGTELGYFQLGSTVILLFQPNQIAWLDTLSTGQPVRMGQALAISHLVSKG